MACVAAFATAGCSSLGAGAALGVPTALAAHEICSAVFISGLDADRAYKSTVAPQLGPASRLLNVKVDPVGQTVTASLAGLASRRAERRGAFGCVVGAGSGTPTASVVASAPPKSELAGPDLVQPGNDALRIALDAAFLEPERPPHRRTYAAVIVHDGRVVAERYAPGVGVETLLHGWSMTKSMTNALLGVLVRQERLDMNAPAPIAAWQDDPRRTITPDDLLRMRSGLDLGQSLSAGWDAALDPANQIMFAQSDMAGVAAGRRLRWMPGTRWRYSDGSTAILGGLIRAIGGGGDATATQTFARRELFDKVGMGAVVFETDGVGTPIAATQAYASARDWARLGLLFLNDGVVEGERVLPSGWVEYSTRVTPGSAPFDYGAGWWANSGAAGEGRPGMPRDSFMARGARGQYVVVVPSARLVVAKLGDADTPRGDIDQMERFVAAAVAAIERPR